MWSNIEKSSIILEETLAIMEKIEIESINSMKKQEEIVLDTSVVSNVDVVWELEKLKRSKQVNDVGISKNKSDMYYTLFGIVWLYQKFIAKDVISRLSKIKDLIKGSIEYSYFWIIRVSILTALRMASQVSQEYHYLKRNI
jgi:ribosomal protein L21